MKKLLSIVIILLGFLIGCDNGGGVVVPITQTEDWTFRSSLTRDTITVFSDKQSVKVGELFEVNIILYNLTNVFGIASEINYSSSCAKILNAIYGPYFPMDNTMALPVQIDSFNNKVSYGITRERNATSIKGSGIVIKLKCIGKAAGEALFTINPNKFDILGADGSKIVRPIENLLVAVHK